MTQTTEEIFQPVKYLYQFSFNCGRMGDLSGLFIATQDEVDAAMGKEIYFGEVLGKHSEISGLLKPGNLKRIDVDQSVIETISEVLGNTWSGYNPLDYLNDTE